MMTFINNDAAQKVDVKEMLDLVKVIKDREKLADVLELAKKVGRVYVSKDLEHLRDHRVFQGIEVRSLEFLERGSIVAIDEELMRKNVEATFNEIILEAF